MPRLKSHNEYVSEVKAVHGESYSAAETYVNADTPILHRCDKRHLNRAKPYSVLQGKGCRTCKYEKLARHLTMSKQEYQKRLSGRSIRLTGQLVNTSTRTEHECLTCKHQWLVKPNGILSGKGCPRCARANFNYARFRTKDYDLGSRIVKVQGFEPFALDLLQKCVSADRISTGDSVPTIPYVFDGRSRIHKPDIYLAHKNLIIEVKSTMTFGFGRPDLFREVCAKYHAAVAAGYKYTIWLFSEYGRLLRLPKGWYDMTYDQFIKGFNESNSARRK